MILHDFIHTPAVSCAAETSLAVVARLMDDNDVGCVVVVGKREEPIGIITDRDVAIRGVAQARAPYTRVDGVMTRRVLVMREDADVFDAASEMASSGCRRMPVVDATGRLMGVVTLDDLLACFAEQMHKLVDTVAPALPRSAASR